MRRVVRFLLLGLVILAVVLAGVGCNKTNPADAETQEIAKKFVEAIFLQKNAALAMTFVGPFQTYGHVNQKFIDDTIADINLKGCVTDFKSVLVGKPGGDVEVAPVTDADQAKGISERLAWTVASNYKCKTDKAPFYRYSVIWLEKVDGKWGVTKASLYFGNPQGY